MPKRRFIALLLLLSAALALAFVSFFRSLGADSRDVRYPTTGILDPDASPSKSHPLSGAIPGIETVPDTDTKENTRTIPEHILKGAPIAPALGNETAKAELGRAAWTLFHTIFARFPDAPTPDEQAALRSYVYLFARLYPCGECAEHFAGVLAQFPPQVSSRSAAATWGCHVHNVVNKRLGKEDFDCSKIGDFYDCGCAGDEKGGETGGREPGGGNGEKAAS